MTYRVGLPLMFPCIKLRANKSYLIFFLSRRSKETNLSLNL